MSKPLSLFDWVKEIILTKRDYKTFTPDDWGNFNPYMIHLLLSMNPKYIQVVEEFQELKCSKEKLYRIYSSFIPKNTRTFYPYIKSKTQKLDKDKLKYISDLYECSINEANEYAELMGDEWVKEIEIKYGINKNDKIKTIKNGKSKKSKH